MSEGNAEKAEVALVDHAPGITTGCKECQKPILQGRYAVGVTIGNHKYLVGHNPPLTCCGQEKLVPLLFSDEPAAEEALKATVATMAKDGNTSGLRLLEAARFISTAKH
jgi:hypothetical protein